MVEELHLQLEKGPSLISLLVLADLLRGYPDKAVAGYLCEGFSMGFRIPSLMCLTSFWSKNLKSVVEMEDVVKKKTAKKMKAGKVLGPIPELPLPNLRVSPLGLFPKKEPGEFLF